MSESNVVELAQPGVFTDSLTEILRSGARPRDSRSQRLIVAPRQSKPLSPLRDSHAATIMPMPRRQDSHSDCRWLPIQIAALHVDHVVVVAPRDLLSDVPIQRCTVHNHRNLLAHAPQRLHDSSGRF